MDIHNDWRTHVKDYARVAKVIVVLTALAACAAVLAAGYSSAPAAADPGAAAEIAKFADPTVAPPDSATLKPFIGVFSRSERIIDDIDLTRARAFSSTGDAPFSLVAAPTKDGGICYRDSLDGAECFATFAAGLIGMTTSYGPIFGLDHYVASGLVPDGIVAVSLNTATAAYSTRVDDNVFRIDLPQKVHLAEVSTYTLTHADGSVDVEPMPAPPSSH
jgi:hypothetical protein